MPKFREDVTVEDVVAMYNNGMSQRDIAKAVGMSQPAIGARLRKAGISTNRGEGGYIARTIPKKDYVAREVAEKQEMAVKNATNACLVVEDRSFSLKGVVGRYEVSAKSKIVFASIGDKVIELDVDILVTLADELKALARNLAGMETCNEMW